MPAKAIHKSAIIEKLFRGVSSGRVAKQLGCDRREVRRYRVQLEIPPFRGPRKKAGQFLSIREAEQRWGQPFESLLKDLAEQDFSMRQAAEVLGCNRETLRTFVIDSGNSPWSLRDVASAWEFCTGESLVAAACRLAQLHTVSQAARIIGYGDTCGLRKALRVRGVEVEFRKRQGYARN